MKDDMNVCDPATDVNAGNDIEDRFTHCWNAYGISMLPVVAESFGNVSEERLMHCMNVW